MPWSVTTTGCQEPATGVTVQVIEVVPVRTTLVHGTFEKDTETIESVKFSPVIVKRFPESEKSVMFDVGSM